MSPKKSWDTLDSATCARWKRSPDRGLPGAEPAQEVAPKGQDALSPRGCRPCLRLGHPDLMIEGRPAKLGQPARESPEPVEKRRLNLETALASRLHERGNDVMRSRILGPHLVQTHFRQFDPGLPTVIRAESRLCPTRNRLRGENVVVQNWAGRRRLSLYLTTESRMIGSCSCASNVVAPQAPSASISRSSSPSASRARSGNARSPPSA